MLKKCLFLFVISLTICGFNNSVSKDDSLLIATNYKNKNEIKKRYSSYNPLLKLETNHPYDMGEMQKDGLVGRHAFFKINSMIDRGYEVCNRFTEYYAPGAFEDMTLSFETITTTEVSLSTSQKFNIFATNGFNITAGIPNYVSISKEYEIGIAYTFSSNATYTASKIENVSMTYTLSDEATNKQSKRYGVGTVGYVYQLNCQYYETHWWWWEHEEILQDTVTNFTMYIVKDPYINVVYQDGTFFKK